MLSRRQILASTPAALAAISLAANLHQARAETAPAAPTSAPGPQPLAPQGYRPVITPNGSTLPFTLRNGVKVMHLIANEFTHEFAPGLRATCWGYNGSTPGPTIELVEGDHVRIYVTNHLPEPTSIHWHGILLPNGMDGVSGLTQKPIPPGETYKYEFTLRQHGAFMYHSHFDDMIQIALGMMGMFIVHPAKPTTPPPDRDFALMLSEWHIPPGGGRPDPSTMNDFNLFTINSRAFPGTAPLVAGLNERVRIRVGNLSPMDHHSFHLHGHKFTVIATDGGDIQPTAHWPETTILVPTGSTRTIELIAEYPGDWAVHCHMSHHTMNQMGHGLPNMLGIDTDGLNEKLREAVPGFMMTMGETGMGEMGAMGMPAPANSIPMIGADGPFSYIDMGGMFTILKIREKPGDYKDPGWYAHPPGTVAEQASAADLAADGIEPPKI